MNSIINRLNGKRILIFGYGREGKSTEAFIKAHVLYASLDVFEGDRSEIIEDDYDVIIKSPGIIMLEDNPKYTSQTELFLDEYHEKTIGITGTKGKSTTSSMLAHVLNECGLSALLLGNIGKPCFDVIDEIGDDTVIVFELSCHQLLHINRAPRIAAFLNLFEEHLDYYGTMDRYFCAKANIISHQTAGDVCFVGENVPNIVSASKKSIIYAPKRKYDLSILGKHNELNAEFVYEIAKKVISEKQTVHEDSGLHNAEQEILDAIKSFKGLPHRLEYFAEVSGVKYYDDSISTIPNACINAVKSVKNTGSVIVGGMDRGIDYGILIDFIKNTPDVLFILCYKTGLRIYEELGFEYEDNSIYPEKFGNVMSTTYIKDSENQAHNDKPANVMLTTDLDCAIKLAKERTEKGRACILSPAAPSYGYFKNFEERGDYFKSLVTRMNYNFYGWEYADKVKPINKAYDMIKSLTDLYDILSDLWCKSTCAPRLQNEWTIANKTLGQCSITAFLVQDIFGGKVYGILRDGGNYHCYNVIDSKVFDLTSEQFFDEAKELVYENNPEQLREVHFLKEEKRLRYENLKKMLNDFLKKNNDT